MSGILAPPDDEGRRGGLVAVTVLALGAALACGAESGQASSDGTGTDSGGASARAEGAPSDTGGPSESARKRGSGSSGADEAPASTAEAATGAAADTVDVGMTDQLTFDPAEVEIRVGQTVRWTNSSVLVHTVTADPAEATMDGSVRLPEGADPFHSGRMEPDETFTRTFTTPGRYNYFCVPHEGTEMRGTVVVKPGA